MKYLFCVLCLVFASCAQTPVNNSNDSRETAAADKSTTTNALTVNAHKSVFPHTHTHGANCGHKTGTSGFDTYYLHDGHKHKVHAGHVDEI